MQLLMELLDVATRETKEVKRMRPYLNKISQMLFKQDVDWVKDKKRGPEAKYLGVAHGSSMLTDGKGRFLKLTFDNSTDSGEFEINSLTPMMIEKGSSLDEDLIKLYEKHGVDSKKKINYMSRDGKTVLREIHLGTNPGQAAVALVKDAIEMFKTRLNEEEDKKCWLCGHDDSGTMRCKCISRKAAGMSESEQFCATCGRAKSDHNVRHPFKQKFVCEDQKYMDERTWDADAKKKGYTVKLSGGSAATRDRIWFAYNVHKKQAGYFYEEDREGSLS